tara:strand:- start:88 stop:1140 length:1053 start_codon:yes stop_codon:yes gene_type:complete
MIPFDTRTLNIDAGPRCTLECSACARQRFREQGKKIPGKDLTPEQFKKIIKYFKHVSFCGTFSDPIFNVHFIELLKICKEENIKTEVHTAATHKLESWWQEAFLANTNANWIFGIDGLPKDSHNYRKNQDGEFLFDMMLLNRYLGMRPEWQYIVFDYNKDDIEEAKEIARKHKLKFMLITSKRPVSKNINNVELEEVKDGKIGWTNSDKETDGENPNNSYASIDYSTGEWTPRPMSKVEEKKDNVNTLKPKCLLTNRDLSYSVTGHILPCCWVNTSFDDTHIKPLFTDNLNIENNNSVEEILNKDEWKKFINVLENNSDENLPSVCKRYCSVAVNRNVENERKLYENYLL